MESQANIDTEEAKDEPDQKVIDSETKRIEQLTKKREDVLSRSAKILDEYNYQKTEATNQKNEISSDTKKYSIESKRITEGIEKTKQCLWEAMKAGVDKRLDYVNSIENEYSHVLNFKAEIAKEMATEYLSQCGNIAKAISKAAKEGKRSIIIEKISLEPCLHLINQGFMVEPTMTRKEWEVNEETGEVTKKTNKEVYGNKDFEIDIRITWGYPIDVEKLVDEIGPIISETKSALGPGYDRIVSEK